MHDAALLGSARNARALGRRWWVLVHDFLPRGNTLDDAEWHRRHRLLEWVLLLHVPALVWLGLAMDHPPATVGAAVAAPLGFLMLGHVVRHRRWASFFITGGLVFCSMALVLLTRGTIEAHFHFFVIIGFIALYQDWVPFLWNVAFTVLSHGLGTAWLGGEQIFNHPSAQGHPWVWSFVHGVAVFAACIGVVLFWRITEKEQEGHKALLLVSAGAEAEIGRRQLTSDLLVNLARRNQSMLYRQLDIINQLENKERDPDALSDLFRIDHLATRIRRNAESLLVLAGEQPPRTWSAPVALRDVVRAAIAETEDLDRVVFAVDDRVSVNGSSVADLTHLLAELTENAVRFSPPETVVTIRARPNRREEGGHLLTVEDWGVGMPPDDLTEANDLLAHPREIDASVSQRLGFHVVARLAARHGIAVSLSATPGSGLTAVAILPPALFTAAPAVAELRSGPDPAETTRLPVTTEGGGRSGAEAPDKGPGGRPAEPEPDPALASAETVRGTDVGPVHQGRPAKPVSEPVMPAADRGTAGTGGPWSGWWLPERATAGRGTNGAAPKTNGHEPVNGHGQVNGHEPVNGKAHGGPAPVLAPSVPAPPAVAPPTPAPPVATPAVVDALEPGPADERPDVADLAEPDARAEDGSPGGPADVQEPGEVQEQLDVPEPAEVEEEAAKAEEADDAPPVTGPPPRATEVPRIPAPATPPVIPPIPGNRPLAAVPHPRMDEPATPCPAPRGPQPAVGGRSLRRRVPQTHLAPELRLAASGLADTATPTATEAAASALSRYQASRRAAQAVVGAPLARPDGEGARA